MSARTKSNALGRALERLETNLETPVVPGELSAWIQNVRDAYEAVRHLLHQEVEEAHEDQYREISEHDPELLPRVQLLRADDRQLLMDCDEIAGKLANLERQKDVRTTNPSEVDGWIADVVKLGLAFVIRARTQEIALSTWLMEAFQRDRGVGD